MTTPNGLATTSTVTVNPGLSPTALLSNMPAGTQIVNIDPSTTATVWVSENPSVTPGIGYPLGPQGSLTWQYDGETAYACVDTGVTDPVSITFGNSVSDLVNPVFVAEALALLGIPATFLQTNVFSATVQRAGTGLNGTPILDVHQYASLIIAPGPAVLNVGYKITYQFYDDLTGFNKVGSGAVSWRPNQEGSGVFIIPVTGKYVQIINNNTLWQLDLVVDGTNRLVPTNKPIVSLDTIISAALTASFLSGTTYDLGPMTLEPGLNSMSFVVGNATCKGLFQIIDVSSNTFVLTDTSETGWHTLAGTTQQFIQKNLVLPVARMSVQFICTVSAGASIPLVVQSMGYS